MKRCAFDMTVIYGTFPESSQTLGVSLIPEKKIIYESFLCQLATACVLRSGGEEEQQQKEVNLKCVQNSLSNPFAL